MHTMRYQFVFAHLPQKPCKTDENTINLWQHQIWCNFSQGFTALQNPSAVKPQIFALSFRCRLRPCGDTNASSCSQVSWSWEKLKESCQIRSDGSRGINDVQWCALSDENTATTANPVGLVHCMMIFSKKITIQCQSYHAENETATEGARWLLDKTISALSLSLSRRLSLVG